LAVPPKPQLSVDAVASNSAQALADHDSQLEAWGDAMALQIGRLCRWAQTNGMKGLDCPKAEPGPVSENDAHQLYGPAWASIPRAEQAFILRRLADCRDNGTVDADPTPGHPWGEPHCG
jgi:hypothetical protein